MLSDYSERVTELESEDVDAACDLWVKIGQWYGERLSHNEYAVHSVGQALRINPNHVGGLAALAGFQRKQSAWVDLADTLNKLATYHADPEAVAGYWMELAEVFEHHIGDAK